MTDQAFRQVLQKPETSGRLFKWTKELGEFDVHFKPRPTLKSQIISDFLVKSMSPIEEEEITEGSLILPKLWSMHIDCSSSKHSLGVGIILTSLDGRVLDYALGFDFSVTNNAAEYEALISGLKIARHVQVKKLRAYTDSQLVASQVQGVFEAKEAAMASYLREVIKHQKISSPTKSYHKYLETRTPRWIHCRSWRPQRTLWDIRQSSLGHCPF
ncbi:RVT_3 domain-containing protein [Cephalotus follicularis]|uniref:RVT_3 domain-containing protein n=1 Tax=Cephalotus follicularis TaxID=3775 RepID=A0A1Q3BHG2_CEPFO|nr:RVT_3 domain-containing protein [Cephalotus follicularis]